MRSAQFLELRGGRLGPGSGPWLDINIWRNQGWFGLWICSRNIFCLRAVLRVWTWSGQVPAVGGPFFPWGGPLVREGVGRVGLGNLLLSVYVCDCVYDYVCVCGNGPDTSYPRSWPPRPGMTIHMAEPACTAPQSCPSQPWPGTSQSDCRQLFEWEGGLW